MAIIGTAEVLMTVRPGPGFTNSIRRATRDLATDFKNDIAVGFAAAFAVAAVAASRFTQQYQKEFDKIIALTDTTTNQLKQFKVAVGEISNRTGTGPEKLVQALYFIQSAGLAAKEGLTGVAAEADRTRQALETLDATARLVALGFGNAEDVAQSLTSLMVAYKDANLSAAEAANIMAKSVQVGKVEGDALAKTVGDFIPLASQMGVSAQQVLALQAAITQTGASASEAATQVRSILTAILDLQTTTDKKKLNLLDQYGLDPKKLKEAVQTDLAGAIQALDELFQGSDESLQILFGNVRAFRGVLSALGSNYQGAVDEIMKANDGLGASVAAQLKITDSFGQKFNRVMSSIKNFAIEFGNNLLPVFAGAATAVGMFVAPLQGIAIWLAKLSPIILITAAAIGAYTLATKASNAVQLLWLDIMTRSTPITTAFQNAMWALHDIIFGVSGVTGAFAANLKSFAMNMVSMTGAIIAQYGPMIALVGAVTVGRMAWEKHNARIQETKENIKQLTVDLADGKSVIDAWRAALDRALGDDKKGDLKALNKLGITREDIDTVSKAIDQLNQLDKVKQDLQAQRGVTLLEDNTDQDFARKLDKQISDIDAGMKVISTRVSEASAGMSFELLKGFVNNSAGLSKSVNDQVKSVVEGQQVIVRSGTNAVVSAFAEISKIQDETLRKTAFTDVYNRLNNLTDAQKNSNITTIEGSAARDLIIASLIKENPELAKNFAAWKDLSEVEVKAKISAIDLVNQNNNLTNSLEEQTTNLDNAAKALDSYNDAVKRQASAQKDVAKAKAELADAKTKTPGELLKEEADEMGRVAAKKSALRAIDEAKLDVDRKQNELDKLKDSQAKAFREAQDRVAAAQLAVKEATEKLNDEQVRHNELMGEIVIRTREVEAAERDRTQASVELERAISDARVAQNKALDEVTNKQFAAVQAARDVTVAQRAIATTALDVEKAQRESVKSGEAITKIYVELAQFANKFAAANLKVESSIVAVSGAQIDALKAASNIRSAQLGVTEALLKVTQTAADQRDVYASIRSKTLDVSSAQRDLNKVFRETTDDSKDAVNAINALRDAQLGLKGSALDVADAQDKLAAAQKALGEGPTGDTTFAQLKRAVDRAKLDLQAAQNARVDAQRKVVDSRTAIADLPAEQARQRQDAVKKLAEAQKSLAQEQAKTASFALDTAKANFAVSDATLNVADAQQKQKESSLKVKEALLGVSISQEDVTKLTVEQNEKISDLVDAQLKQKESLLGIKDAQFAVLDAQNNILVAQQKYVESQQAVADAQQAYELSTRALQDLLSGTADANKKVFDSETSVLSARLSLQKTNDDIAKSDQNLRDLRDDVARKTDAVGQAEADLDKARPGYKTNLAEINIKEAELKAARDKVATATNAVDILEKNQAAERLTIREAAAKKIKDATDKLTEAQDKLAEANRDVNKAQGEYDLAKQAAINKLTKEQADLAEKFFRMTELAKTAGPELKKSIQDVLDQIKNAGLNIGLYPAIDSQGNLVLTTQRQLAGLAASQRTNSLDSTSGNQQVRAAGGPVSAGQPYLVNELGTELYKTTNGLFAIQGGMQVRSFPTDGTIIPANRAEAYMGGYVDNSVHHWNVQSNATDNEIAARDLQDRIRRERINGRGR